mgnify:CR=1 FL=1
MGLGNVAAISAHLSGRELGCCSLELVFGGSLCAIDAFSHFDGVEIDLHDTFFGPEEFYQYGEVDFQSFTYQEDWGHRNTFFAVCWLMVLAPRFRFLVSFSFIAFCISMKSIVVCGKPVVFRGNDGHRQVRGYLVGRYPSVVPAWTFTLKDLLHAANNHQWRDVDGYKTISHYR